MQNASVFLGTDFPIGLPLAYARKIGAPDFPSFLHDHSPEDDLFQPALTPDDMGLHRPFYPARPGGARRAHLEEALGLPFASLLRLCDRRTNAACMFWTLGPQQCGRAALAGWRDLILGSRPRLWPFDGPLAALLTNGVTLAETYPALAYRLLGLPAFAKSRQESRAVCARRLAEWTERTGADIDTALVTSIEAGFPMREGADHAFDSLVGALFMLALVRGLLPWSEPERSDLLLVEGWMLGLDGPANPIPPSCGPADGARSRGRSDTG